MTPLVYTAALIVVAFVPWEEPIIWAIDRLIRRGGR